MMKQRKNSYRFDAFDDPSQEAARLKWRTDVNIERFIPTLREHGLNRNMRVLDVGSGTGHRALRLAHFLTAGSVVGIDNSADLLSQAGLIQSQAKRGNLEFRLADIYSRSSLAKLGRFDFIHLRLVMQHLPDTKRALRNLKLLLKPKGRIFLEDIDREWMTIYPCPPIWPKVYLAVQAGQAGSGGDPYSGRKLGFSLASAGFKDIKVQMTSLQGGNDLVSGWLENAAPTYLYYLNPSGQRSARKAFAELARLCKKGPIYYYQVWFQASGMANR